MKDVLDDMTMWERSCSSRKSPNKEEFQRYAQGLYATLDEHQYHAIEDHLYEDRCRNCLELVHSIRYKTAGAVPSHDIGLQFSF